MKLGDLMAMTTLVACISVAASTECQGGKKFADDLCKSAKKPRNPLSNVVVEKVVQCPSLSNDLCKGKVYVGFTLDCASERKTITKCETFKSPRTGCDTDVASAWPDGLLNSIELGNVGKAIERNDNAPTLRYSVSLQCNARSAPSTTETDPVGSDKV